MQQIGTLSRFRRVGTWLFPLLLAATLLQNYYDLTAIFAGENLALYSYEGPIFYKIGKDIIYLLLMLLVLRTAYKRKRSPLTDYSLALISLILVLAIVSAVFNGPIVAVIGLRWAFPFILFLLLRDWSEALDTLSATRWLFIGMFVCLSAQIYQLFNMPPVFGELFSGISARTPGIFMAPNSAAFFACASAACIMVFSTEHSKTKVSAVIFSMLISMLAQSGTGIIASVFLMLWMISGRSFTLFFVLALFMLLTAIPNLNELTMRDDYVEASGGGRLDSLYHIIDVSIFSLSGFGIFTNAANLQSNNPEDQVAPDSLIASWIGNFGASSIVAVGLVVVFIRYRMRTIDWGIAAPCVITLAAFSMTTIVFEAFPMNIYLALGIWSARKLKPENH